MKLLIGTVNLLFLVFISIYYIKLVNIIQYIKTQKILFQSQKGSYFLAEKQFILLSMLYLLIIFLLGSFSLVNLQIYFELIIIFFVLVFFTTLKSYNNYIILESSLIYAFYMKEYKISDIKGIKIIPISKNRIRIKLFLDNRSIDIFLKSNELQKGKIFLETKVLRRSLSAMENELLFRKLEK
ncbi:MAG: hypothetical protein ACRCWG_00770 [Sarcina sp.]